MMVLGASYARQREAISVAMALVDNAEKATSDSAGGGKPIVAPDKR